MRNHVWVIEQKLSNGTWSAFKAFARAHRETVRVYMRRMQREYPTTKFRITRYEAVR